MVIKKKSLGNKKYYELLGQLSFFGRDNLPFKTVNMPKAQKYDNLCNKFKLKKIILKTKLLLSQIDIK